MSGIRHISTFSRDGRCLDPAVRGRCGVLFNYRALANPTWVGREHPLHVWAAGRASHAEQSVLVHAHGLYLVFHRV